MCWNFPLFDEHVEPRPHTNSILKRILVSVTSEDHCGLGVITEKQRKHLLKIPKGGYVCVKKKKKNVPILICNFGNHVKVFSVLR